MFDPLVLGIFAGVAIGVGVMSFLGLFLITKAYRAGYRDAKEGKPSLSPDDEEKDDGGREA